MIEPMSKRVRDVADWDLAERLLQDGCWSFNRVSFGAKWSCDIEHNNSRGGRIWAVYVNGEEFHVAENPAAEMVWYRSLGDALHEALDNDNHLRWTACMVDRFDGLRLSDKHD